MLSKVYAGTADTVDNGNEDNMAEETQKAKQHDARPTDSGDDATMIEMIERFALAAEFKEEDTTWHVRRISRYSEIIADKLGLPAWRVRLIRMAAVLHDVGKVRVPDAILLKPARLNPEEWVVIKKHTIYGARILGRNNTEIMKEAETIAFSHHEHWDGSGYPKGLKACAISESARIVCIADVFDALTSRRPYKAPFSMERSLEIIRDGRGHDFDPTAVDALLACEHDVRLVMETCHDDE